MSHLATSETRPGFTVEFCRAATSVRELNFDFIAHKMTFIVFGNTLLGGFTTVEFLQKKN